MTRKIKGQMENKKKKMIKLPRSCAVPRVVLIDFCGSLPIQDALRFYIGSAMKL